jgi:hypothetical protein
LDLQIVNPDAKYSKVDLVEPTAHGFIYVAAAVRPGSTPLVLANADRKNLLEMLKHLADGLLRLGPVVNATVFRAIVMPPTSWFSRYLKEHRNGLHVANFDVLVLIETTSPETAREVQESAAYRVLVDVLRVKAETLHMVAARNIRRIANVDTTRQGLFLFNHFAADDAGVMRQLWEYLADWYAVETGLDNSVALAPVDGERSDYAIINWARWDTSPTRHFWHQLSKRSFWRYVTANLDANHAASMPIYCRLA